MQALKQQIALALYVLLTPSLGFALEARELGLLPEPNGDVLGFENPGPVPALPAQGELHIQKVRPADCRVVLGFVHSPVDGRPDSWGYNGVVNEYDDSQGYVDGHWQNICYEFIKDPGVHVTLADDKGFNYLYLRGGFGGRIYRDVDVDDGPGKGTLLATTKKDDARGSKKPLHFRITRLALDKTVASNKISFFGREGLLADAEFLRIGKAAVAEKYTGTLDFVAGDAIADLTTLGPDFVQWPCAKKEDQHPSNFVRRFPRSSDRTVHISTHDRSGKTIPLGASQQVHLMTPILPAHTPVGAVRFELEISGVPKDNLVNLTVQDPLIGNQELIRVDVRMNDSPRVRCILDFPDQLMAEGTRFWVTIASQHAGKLEASSKISLLTVAPEVARAEHLAWRLFLLKGYFYVLSELRPWTGQDFSLKWLEEYDGKDMWVQRTRPQLLDLYRTVEHLKAIEPQHPIAVKQYYDWLTRKNRPGIDPGAVPELPAISGVPRWAQMLDHAARTLVDIPNWWITHRMASTGELGGFLGDDTDLVPWWMPIAFLDSEFMPRLRQIDSRMANLVLAKNLRDGVNIQTLDALHAYEEGQNLMCHMPLLFYGDPRYVEWLMISARTVDKWMVRDATGKLKFRVNDFSWETAMHPPEKPAELVSGNAPLLLHSHLMLAWYNHNPHAIQTLADFSDPSAGNALDGYGAEGIPFAAYWFTGDAKYLGIPPDGRDKKGRNWWARFQPEYMVHVKEMHSQPWWKEYAENAARAWDSGDWAWAAGQNREVLGRSLEYALYGNPAARAGGAERYRYIWTEAEMFTDRVFLPVETIAQPMLGGYTVRNRIFPTYAVSFENLGGDFAALVLEQGRNKLKIAMINLRDKLRDGAFRVWQLDHGRYELKIGPDANDDGTMDSVEKTETLELARMSRLTLKLPPRKLMIYELTQIERLDDLFARPDLAMTADDVVVTDKTVQVTVHNIGASTASDFEVALTSKNGKVLASKTVKKLEAPLDLIPRTITVELPRVGGGVGIMIDPRERLSEITRENNGVVPLEK